MSDVFFHATPNPDACKHEFDGWREFPDGNGGERVCRHCGLGAMAWTLAMDDERIASAIRGQSS